MFFVCSGCNETLKKNKVDAHASRCRDCWAVSCVDCSVVFPGNDYAAHTSCVSEAEKYERTLYKGPKAGAGGSAPVGGGGGGGGKGGARRSPQDIFMAAVAAAAASASEPARVRELLGQLHEQPNVPRKKPKFLNFVLNSFRLSRDAPLAAALWSAVEKQMPAPAAEGAAGGGGGAAAAEAVAAAAEAEAEAGAGGTGDGEEAGASDGGQPAASAAAPSRKRKAQSEVGEPEPGEASADDAALALAAADVRWARAAQKVLKAAESTSGMRLKDLRAATCAACAAKGATDGLVLTLRSQFSALLAGNAKFVVEGRAVRLAAACGDA